MFSSSGGAGGRGRGAAAKEGRLDDDQLALYNQTVDLLLAAGYFRARVVSLSRFDRVVGGMSWCVMNSYVDIDISLDFVEEAQIGQRIRLAEQIVGALLRMKCPHRLEPSQIQGGMHTADYGAIFPVVQWLVAQVLETRRETGDLVRKFSEAQFGKAFEMPQDTAAAERQAPASAFLETSSARFSSERRLCRPGRRVPYLSGRSESDAVSTALMEYGELSGAPGGGASAADEDGGPEGSASALRSKLEGAKAREERLRREADEAKAREALRATMRAAAAAGKGVDAGMLEGMLGDLSSLEEQFGASADALAAMDPEAAAALFAQRQHDQKVARLERDIENQQAANDQLQQRLQQLDQALEEAAADAAAKVKYNTRLLAEIAKLEALVTDDNRETLAMLQALVALNESLKQQAAAFKQSCKRQLEAYQARIADLQAKAESGAAAEERRQVQATFDADEAKLAKLRSLAALKARRIALVQRKIDEIPSRAELAQYQKQFVELYEQVASKLIETRQYYETFNALQRSKDFLAREVTLLQSAHDNYVDASKSKGEREKYLQWVGETVAGVEGTLAKQQKRYQAEKSTKAKAAAKLGELVSTERAYYQASKELQDECATNDKLMHELAAIKQRARQKQEEAASAAGAAAAGGEEEQ